MLDSPEALLRSIRLGEGAHLELQEVVFAGKRVKGPGCEQLADALAAFANGHGGVLVLGVDDRTRDIVGIALDRLDAAEQYLTEIVHDSIKPPIYPLIERLELPDSEGVPRPVLRVEVSPSLFVHESPGGFLHRVGSAKRRMEPDFLVRLHQQRSQSRLIRFDEQPLHDASFADLDGALIDRFAVDGMRDDRETLACKLGMAARSGARGLLPTVTGILLGTTEPVERLPHAYVQAVAYRGRSVPESLESPWYQLDAGDIAGPVDRQIAGACLFVLAGRASESHDGRGPCLPANEPQRDPHEPACQVSLTDRDSRAGNAEEDPDGPPRQRCTGHSGEQREVVGEASGLRDVRRRVAVDDPRRRPGRRGAGGGHVTADAGRDMAA